MTIPWPLAQLARGSLALIFPWLWGAGSERVVAVALPLTLLALMLGRASVARGGLPALRLSTATTPGAGLPVSRRAGAFAAACGLIGELALGATLLTVAAEARRATLAGPIAAMQLITSPWPALLGMGLAFVPLVRLSLVECAGEEARRRAWEAAAVTLSGILLVGWGGPAWWP